MDGDALTSAPSGSKMLVAGVTCLAAIVVMRFMASLTSLLISGRRHGDGERDERLVFLPDAEIGSSWFFRLVKALTLPFARWFWRMRIEGLENAPQSGGCLFIGMHTTHNHDIFASIFAVQDRNGRVVRSLVHRTLMVRTC